MCFQLLREARSFSAFPFSAFNINQSLNEGKVLLLHLVFRSMKLHAHTRIQCGFLMAYKQLPSTDCSIQQQQLPGAVQNSVQPVTVEYGHKRDTWTFIKKGTIAKRLWKSVCATIFFYSSVRIPIRSSVLGCFVVWVFSVIVLGCLVFFSFEGGLFSSPEDCYQLLAYFSLPKKPVSSWSVWILFSYRFKTEQWQNY